MKNSDIRSFAKEKGVRLWEIADALKINVSTFSVRLRHELPKTEKERILSIVNQISTERS